MRKLSAAAASFGAVLLAATFSSALAQDPLKTLPKNYQVAFENDLVRVIRVHYAPREKIALHDHSTHPAIYVYLSGSGPVRFSHVETRAFSIVRPAVKKGMFRVSPGRIEKHTVENLGGMASDFLRIELKQVPLGHEELAFRGNQPVSTAKDGATVLFDSRFLKIRRLVISQKHFKRHFALSSAGLLVALERSEYGTGKQALENGAVLWTPPSFDMASKDSAAHLLWLGLEKRSGANETHVRATREPARVPAH